MRGFEAIAVAFDTKEITRSLTRGSDNCYLCNVVEMSVSGFFGFFMFYFLYAAIDTVGWGAVVAVVAWAVGKLGEQGIHLAREWIVMLKETGWSDMKILKQENARLEAEAKTLREDNINLRYVNKLFEEVKKRELVDTTLIGMPGEIPERKSAEEISGQDLPKIPDDSAKKGGDHAP